MGVAHFERAEIMATPWRRRRMCVLVADRPVAAMLRDISGAGAFLETNACPEPGSKVELRHPEAGSIPARVRAVCGDGVEIAFIPSPASVGFALAAIAADMCRPG